MSRELPDQLVDLRRRSKFGSIGPIVQHPKRLENERRYLADPRMPRIEWNSDRERRIAHGQGRSFQSVFENGADVVTAAKKNALRMSTDIAKTRWLAPNRLGVRCHDATTDSCNCEFTG